MLSSATSRPDIDTDLASRGALLRGDTLQQIEKDALELQDARPDHKRFRCVIGVYNTATQKLSGFTASTVPNANAVFKCWSLYAAGKPLQGNMLPSGCYNYYIGAHGTRSVPGCFKQGRSDSDREKLTTLRSPKDVSYDIGDFWDSQSNGGMPYDNIHPSFYNDTFSSEGCQTVRGTWSGGPHNLQFEALRKAAGLTGSRENGRRFDYVLVTGLEAAIASNLRTRGLATDKAVVRDQLTRLRHGSRGEAVKALQKALGVPETGFLTKDDKKKIVDLQVASLAARLKDRRLTLDVDPAAREWLAIEGFDPAYGARPLRRLVQREIGDRLARMLLAGEVHDGDTVRVTRSVGDAPGLVLGRV